MERDKIIKKAIHDCMCEMYAKSQPSADWDKIVDDYRTGKLGKDDRIYERHYLSYDEFIYIRDKYKKAYNIKRTWVPHLDFLEDLLRDGGLKDKYNPDWTDEQGNHHPGYRSAENVKPLKEQISDIMREFDCSEIAQEVGREIYDKVMDTIENYKDFYRFDREEEQFDVSISLGASPSSNAESVKKWWKENHNEDIEIEERNPILFWYRDNGYTDEDLEIEFDSENWKEIVDKQWKEERLNKNKK